MSLSDEISGISITDFEFGLLSKNADGTFYVSDKTKEIPNIPGQFFGFIFHYTNNTGKTVEHRWEMILPDSPEVAETIDGSTNIESVPLENRVISSTAGLDISSSIQYSVNRIDSGDPSGEWIMKVYIGSRVYKTLILNVS